MRATGIHFHRKAARLVTLEDGEDGRVRLCAASELELPVPYGPEALSDADCGRQLAEVIRDGLSNGGKTGTVLSALPGGCFQIQKVPLEVASEDDRRSQMVWEAAQGLAATCLDLEIGYIPARRSAFWVASRSVVHRTVEQIFRSAGVDPVALMAEPIALVNACVLSETGTEGSAAAVYFCTPWLCILSVEDGVLLSAESIRIREPATRSGDAVQDESNAGWAAVDLVRRWLTGDPKVNRRRSGDGRLLVCGDNDCTDLLIRAAGGPNAAAVPLSPFSGCVLPAGNDQMPDRPHRQSDFAIAAGLACSGLARDKTP